MRNQRKLERHIGNVRNGGNGNKIWKINKNERPTRIDVSSNESIEDFDDILAIIGSKGLYQKLLLYCVLTPMMIALPLISFNILFIHGEMDHWCSAPGIENFNQQEMLQWKNQNLPLEKGPDGNLRFSQCKMYDLTNQTGSREKIDCPSGWIYNRTYLSSTINSDYNWVCSRNGYLTLLYTVGTVGTLLGSFIFGPLADKCGRKPIFFIGLCITLSFGFLSLFAAGNYAFYLVLTFISSTGVTGGKVVLILAELSDDQFRSWIFSFNAAIWVLGVCLVPLIAYLAQHWFIIGLITYLPCFTLLLSIFFIPESPRWLVSVGRTKEAATIIKKVAKVNGTDEYIEDESLMEALEHLVKKQTTSEQQQKYKIGIWALFTHLNVFKNTILLTIEQVGCGMLYGAITLNTPNLAGNQFINFFLLAIIEFPASFFAGYLIGTLGRRWSLVFTYFISSVTCIFASFLVGDPKSYLAIVAMIITKFSINISSIGLSVQINEIYPTPFRSTGQSIISIASGLICLTTPSIIYLGKYFAPGPYIVMGSIAFMASIAASFLPETLKRTLPETIEQANEFGKTDKYWQVQPRPSIRSIKYGSLKRRASQNA